MYENTFIQKTNCIIFSLVFLFFYWKLGVLFILLNGPPTLNRKIDCECYSEEKKKKKKRLPFFVNDSLKRVHFYYYTDYTLHLKCVSMCNPRS